MRPLFFLLLLANVIAFLLLQLTQQFGNTPDRTAQQINAERLLLMDGSAKNSAGAATAGAALAADAAYCLEIGDFNGQSASAFEQQLAKLASNLNPQRRVVQPAPSQQIFIPPLANEEAASQRLVQLRGMGFTDSAVIRDETARRWGISLGRFTHAELAEAHLEKLRTAGVQDARLGEYPLNSTRYAVQVSVDDADLRDRMKSLIAKSVGITLRACH
jgi:hypothetical protein